MSNSGTCHDPAAGHREPQHQRLEDRSSALRKNHVVTTWFRIYVVKNF
jgi:hypothetical protein